MAGDWDVSENKNWCQVLVLLQATVHGCVLIGEILGRCRAQLRQQISIMRSCTQSYIDRVNNRSTYNFYELVPGTVCGPFIDEEHFDEWCLSRVPDGLFGLTRKKRTKWMEKECQRPSREFVLTHGNLSLRNIIVDDGVVTGIVDWEMSAQVASGLSTRSTLSP